MVVDRTHGVRPDDASTDTDPASGDGAAITVDHALGTTTIDGPVERVVALGLTDLDAALALGAPVVGAASSGLGDGVPPWTDAAEGADVTVLEVSGDASSVDLEEVAALEPDLILAATYYDIDEAYENGGVTAAREALEASPLYPSLGAVERGAIVDLDDDQFFALRQPTVLSVPYIVDSVAPALAEAAAAG